MPIKTLQYRNFSYSYSAGGGTRTRTRREFIEHEHEHEYEYHFIEYEYEYEGRGKHSNQFCSPSYSLAYSLAWLGKVSKLLIFYFYAVGLLAFTVICQSELTAQDSATPAGSPSKDPGLLLEDFRPIPRLQVDATMLERARYPVIDVHTHFSIRLRHDPDALDRFVELMDRNNIALCTSLDGTLGSQLDKHIQYLWTKYPDRFAIFANIDFIGNAPKTEPEKWLCNQPDFARNTVEQLIAAKQKGISGLKIFKQLGLEYKNADGSWLAIDDPRLDPIWEVCGELGLPVIMHTADPSAFFEKADASNERFEELARHPDWAFPSDKFPARAELHAARNRVIEKHTKTQFIMAHLGNDAEDLKQTAAWLERYPNLHIEIASRISELGRQPFTARAFLEKYSDRIMFGTDGPWPEKRIRLYWRFLETHDEYFPYSEKDFPPQGFWNIYGVKLDASTLKKIYYENAKKLIPGVAERFARWEGRGKDE